MKKSLIGIVFLASLPILLPIINPSIELGALGMILGFWGTFVSPVVIFGFLLYLLFRKSK